jgi:hypothetical protein
MEYNCERIPRKGKCLQWSSENTPEIMAFLAQHGMIGELFRDIHIQVYKDGSYSTTLNIGSWLIEGEDSKLRIYDDETHKLMYQPIVKNDELERLKVENEKLKAFALAILNLECPGFQRWQKESIAEKYGITADSLKVTA